MRSPACKCKRPPRTLKFQFDSQQQFKEIKLIYYDNYSLLGGGIAMFDIYCNKFFFYVFLYWTWGFYGTKLQLTDKMRFQAGPEQNQCDAYFFLSFYLEVAKRMKYPILP